MLYAKSIQGQISTSRVIMILLEIVAVPIGMMHYTIHQYATSIYHDQGFYGMPVVAMTDFVNGYNFYTYYHVGFCGHWIWTENKNVAFKMD